MSAHTWPQNLRHALAQLSAIVTLILLIAVAASAYTLVLRDGRRIEIPAEFILTRTTLTYEISPGFNQTFVLSLVDIAATERANGEPLGGFFKHRQDAVRPPATNNEPVRPAVKTLTNLDLDAVRQRRVESEQAYESRRKQLGLPTLEESRRRQDAEATEMRQMARAKNEADARDEAFWKGRARELRNEIAMVDSQISYLRGRVYDANQQAMQNRSWVTGVYPTWRNGPWPNGNFPNGRYPDARPNGPIIGMGLPNIYGSPNVYGYPGPYGYPGTYGYPTYGYPNGSINNNPPYSSDPVELNGRLDDLLVRRQGLAMQWRQLEDDARDARIPQVWLEP
ncbi:MAG TPA: hypothetical protein VHQ64_13890 [Pyrinomonadaceae bacterium]|jgi:hypothetical protein|nr:hypothetical protein [Pyrinomonadaceae bacterium]